MKFGPSVCIAVVASLTDEMAAQSFAYHAHGTADSDIVCAPWQNIKSAMHDRSGSLDDKSMLNPWKKKTEEWLLPVLSYVGSN